MSRFPRSPRPLSPSPRKVPCEGRHRQELAAGYQQDVIDAFNAVEKLRRPVLRSSGLLPAPGVLAGRHLIMPAGSLGAWRFDGMRYGIRVPSLGARDR